MPGEHISYKNDRLFINGKPIEEPYLEPLKKELRQQKIAGSLTEDFSLEQYTEEKIIPEGFVFVMGDNRRNSKDSRILGFIPINKIIGKASIVYWTKSDIRFAK